MLQKGGKVMSAKEVIAVMFACILANNYVFQNFFGVEAVALDSEKGIRSMLASGLTVTAVLVVSTLVTWPLNAMLAGGASYLQTLVFAIVTTAVVYIADFVAKKVSKEHKCEVLPIAINSVVMGACLVNAANGYGFGTSVLASIGVGIGYLLATFVVAGVRERVNEKFIPKAWRGAPILVAEMAIIALTLFAL